MLGAAGATSTNWSRSRLPSMTPKLLGHYLLKHDALQAHPSAECDASSLLDAATGCRGLHCEPSCVVISLTFQHPHLMPLLYPTWRLPPLAPLPAAPWAVGARHLRATPQNCPQAMLCRDVQHLGGLSSTQAHCCHICVAPMQAQICGHNHTPQAHCELMHSASKVEQILLP